MDHLSFDYEKHFEELMRRVAYLYFVGKTAGLLILVDFFVFKKPLITLFLLLVAGCYYINLKVFRLYMRWIRLITSR